MVERNADMSTLTQRYTDEAIDFIRKNKARPFFVYLAHSMPHTKLAASDRFRGKSAGGLFGDVVEELDWHVGRLLDTLKAEGLDESTHVIFTSDNGLWYLDRPLVAPADPNTRGPKGALKYPFTQRAERGAHGGSAGPLRGAKTSAWEGGFRVPCIVRAPGRVSPGTVCDELATTLDFLPTCAKLAGAKTPADRVIDGHDITALLHRTPGAPTPTKEYYFYQRHRLTRSGLANGNSTCPALKITCGPSISSQPTAPRSSSRCCSICIMTSARETISPPGIPRS